MPDGPSPNSSEGKKPIKLSLRRADAGKEEAPKGVNGSANAPNEPASTPPPLFQDEALPFLPEELGADMPEDFRAEDDAEASRREPDLTPGDEGARKRPSGLPARLKLKPADASQQNDETSSANRLEWSPMEETEPLAPLSKNEDPPSSDTTVARTAQMKLMAGKLKGGPPPIDAPIAKSAANGKLGHSPNPEANSPAPEADTPSTEDHANVQAAVTKAIKAGREQPEKKRLIKLLTAAAGLGISVLAVWWSFDSLPFVFSEKMPTSRSTTAALPGATADRVPWADELAGSNPEVAAYVASLRIDYVNESADPFRIIVGGVSYEPGQILHRRHALLVKDLDTQARRIIFADAEGGLYARDY